MSTGSDSGSSDIVNSVQPVGTQLTLDLRCAHFADFLQNYSERQIFLKLCSVVFHALTLKLPIQTSLFVAPELPVSLRF